MSHGVTVGPRNLQLPGGEVDAICIDNGVRLIVEVRTSSSSVYPLDAIGRSKRAQLRSLADRLGIRRIDLIGVGINAGHVVFHWYPDAV